MQQTLFDTEKLEKQPQPCGQVEPFVMLRCGDCLDIMPELTDKSIDAIITDPPYGLEFMGKDWDKGVPGVPYWEKMLRVMKPGGYLLAFSGTRTYHRMASAIEDAGFEIRDMIEWVYGSGFPKSHNIGKSVDKLQGNEREVVGVAKGAGKNPDGYDKRPNNGEYKPEYPDTKGTSEWEGWGSNLKPAHEPICMARKPLSEKTVAENVLKHGTGGINIDESRVETSDNLNGGAYAKNGNRGVSNSLAQGGGMNQAGKTTGKEFEQPTGRFPANLIHDNSEEVRKYFPETKSGGKNGSKYINKTGKENWSVSFGADIGKPTGICISDSGNASRFFKSIIYQAKASKSERGKGNNHPTVKPVRLMEYLINMTTKERATVLDPFMGSGSTGVACKNTNRNFIGIEKDGKYFEIAKQRIEAT